MLTDKISFSVGVSDVTMSGYISQGGFFGRRDVRRGRWSSIVEVEE